MKIISGITAATLNIGEPQAEQKFRWVSPPWSSPIVVKVASVSPSALKPSLGTATITEKGLPVWRWQSVQWQAAWTTASPSAVKVTLPQRQRPVIGEEAMARTVHPRRVSVITYKRMAMAVKPDAVKPDAVGERVKALREASGLSLRDLAVRSGVSAPMLSQVERGDTSPTLTVAARIAAGLELTLSQLLRLDEGGSVTIVRPRQRSRGGSARRRHTYEVLTASQPGQRAELSRHTLAAGGATGAEDDPPMHEPGSRETALVESGSVVLVCDGQRHHLDTGDCVTFDADLPHHFENPAGEPAVFLAVLSAGLRRS